MKTKEYGCRASYGRYQISLSFTGSDQIGKENPAAPDMYLECMYDGKEIWKRKVLPDTTPGGPWLGIQLLQAFGGLCICGIGTEIHAIDLPTGIQKHSARLGNTAIRHIKKYGKKLLVHYDSYKFDNETYWSNLIAVNSNLETLWKAEMPTPDDNFISEPEINWIGITATTWEGWVCRLSSKTGKIKSKHWTK